jgi:hypothetical protein
MALLKEFPMIRRCLVVLLPLVFVASLVAAEDALEPKEIVERMIAAAGGEAFASLGILELEVTEEETRSDGTQTGKSYKLLVDTSNLNNLRMDLPGDTVVAATEGGGWSTTAGALDDRPQASTHARTSLNQKVFRLLLPFSLKMDGVWLKEVRESATSDGREVWVIAIPFTKGFFTSPVMATTWILVVAKDDYSLISIEFAPAPAFRDVSPVGVRYRILKQKELQGASVIEQVLAVGINSKYQESGATRVTKIKPSIHGPWDPTLFLSPAQLAALEEDD